MRLTRIRELALAWGSAAILALLSAATVLADGTGTNFPK